MAYKDNSTNFNFSRKRKNRTFKDVVFVTFKDEKCIICGSPSQISEKFGLPYSSIYSTLQKALRLQDDKAAMTAAFNACGCKWCTLDASEIPDYLGIYRMKAKWEQMTKDLQKPHAFHTEAWEKHRKAKQ